MDTGYVQSDGLARYVNVLENVFVAIRGRGVQWSAEDRARARRWHGMGVPLPTVVSAIEQRAKAYRFMHGDVAHMPIGLRSYERAVLGRPGALLPGTLEPRSPGQAHPSEEHDERPEDALLQLVHALPRLVEETDDPAISEAYRRAGRSLERSLRGDTKDTERGIDHEAALAAIDRANSVLRKTTLVGVGTAAAAAVQDEVSARLDAEPPMTRTARTRRHAKLLDRALSSRYGVRWASPDGWRSRR